MAASYWWNCCQMYSINTFDDETERYKIYPNSWLWDGAPEAGYCTITNTHYPHITIERISVTKLTHR